MIQLLPEIPLLEQAAGPRGIQKLFTSANYSTIFLQDMIIRCPTSSLPSHRITESQNVRGWKGPLWVIQSNPSILVNMVQAIKLVPDLEGEINLNSFAVDGSCNSWAPFICLEYLEEQSYKVHIVYEKMHEHTLLQLFKFDRLQHHSELICG